MSNFMSISIQHAHGSRTEVASHDAHGSRCFGVDGRQRTGPWDPWDPETAMVAGLTNQKWHLQNWKLDVKRPKKLVGPMISDKF